MLKKLIFIGVVLLILAFLGYNYVYQDHRDIAQEEAEYVLEAENMIETFMSDPGLAEKKYLNKTLAVKGKITQLNGNNLTLDHKVFCQFDKLLEGLKLQETVSVKGRCIGFDSLLEEVKLDQCSISINND